VAVSFYCAVVIIFHVTTTTHEDSFCCVVQVSRATFLTGQYMSRHGTRRTVDLIRPWDELFPSFLKKAGYYIGYCGKDGVYPFHGEKYDFSRFYSGYHIDEKEDGGRHITQRAQDDAIEFLQQRPRDKPFYMTVAFYATHAIDGDPRQYIPTNQSMSLYQDTVVPIPATGTDESWKRMPPFFNEQNEGRTRWHWRFDEPEKHQRMMKNLYRLITEVDTAIGKTLNTLEEQGELNNTLVIFTTDNGVRIPCTHPRRCLAVTNTAD
jgi:arylsulfatase A-like enzyme